jgi:hypothetical protein
MSLLEKLKRGHRAKAVNAPRLDRHASEHSPTDEWVLDDLKRDSNQFRERLETPIELQDGRSYEPSADIHDDLFLTAHASGESKVKESERVRPSHRFGRDVLDAFVKTDDHRGAKPYTEGDELASAIYSTAAANKFDEAMRDESVRQEIEQSQQTHEDEQRLKDIEQRIKEIRDEARDTPGGIPGPLVEEFGQLGDERNGIIDGLPIDSNGLPASNSATTSRTRCRASSPAWATRSRNGRSSAISRTSRCCSSRRRGPRRWTWVRACCAST